jgi:hypothetical protein
MILLGATALFSKLLPLSAVDITFGRAVVACMMLLLSIIILHQLATFGFGFFF